MPTKFNLDRFKMGYVIRYKNDGSKFSNMIEKKQLVEGFKLEMLVITTLKYQVENNIA